MKQTVISNPTVDGNGRPTTSNDAANNPNGINVPINRQYGGQPSQTFSSDPNAPGYSSPSNSRQFPHHFQQGFGFDQDMDGMFSDAGMRSRLGRMQDPFGTFGSRKRCGNEPQANNYFNDDPDFFPQFGTLGSRRRAGTNSSGSGAPTTDHHSDDFFDNFPSEFRQYMPEGFGMGHRRAGSAGPQQYPQMPTMSQHSPQFYQTYVQPNSFPTAKNLCDAAIQTENLQNDAVDGSHNTQENLKNSNFRNTVDLGVKSAPEDDNHSARSQSAPPNEPQLGGSRSSTPSRTQFSTQTSPPVNGGPYSQVPYQKYYYPPQSQSHQQSQQTATPPPTTPGGSHIRTIPIFVEGRSEPIINSHKEIPNQYQTSNNNSSTYEQPGRKFTPPQQQHQSEYQPHQQQKFQPQQHHYQQRPTPLNTQQATNQYEQQKSTQGIPPQTPHTLESINKIQDIQRDVLELMTQVEKFTGVRQDKEYGYLDEMLTRNLLKLDTIDTNGKESIRMARKEAIKCIQASINVLEAKAGQNAKTANIEKKNVLDNEVPAAKCPSTTNIANHSSAVNDEAQQIDPKKSQEAIPLPPPESIENNQSSESSKMEVDVNKSAESTSKTE